MLIYIVPVYTIWFYIVFYSVMSKLLNEFKDFAMKGNVVDLAVWVVIGTAFGKIVSSLVESVIMPIVGILMQGKNFADLALGVGDAQLKYGAFIQAVVDFLIVAAVLFLVVKAINHAKDKMTKKKPAAPETPKGPTTEELLADIRDLLKKNK